ncbi:MAG: response regulator [Candidatus Omnitrophica bacterium]|nr:response regulator [Candidatus Omnitrophota bacterium]
MKKVLIIDDDREFSDLLKVLLSGNGYEAIIVNDPREGVTVTEKEKPDVVILDDSMPAMNGREVCEALKKNERTKSIPVIFLTGRDVKDDPGFHVEVGASAYLAKPFDSDCLLESIKFLSH